MVVVHRAYGFRFVIYVHDHEPPHVHVYGAGQAKIAFVGEDGLPDMVSSFGMKNNEKARVLTVVEERIDYFWKEWERLHG